MDKTASAPTNRRLPDREDVLKDLGQTYSFEKVLSEKHHRLFLAVNKTSGEKVVIRSMPEAPLVYGFLRAKRPDGFPAVYDVIPARDGAVVLEEYIDGADLGEILRGGTYSYKEAVKTLRAVCAALTVLHENGFVHRDLKPENVMIEKNGAVKLIDCGACRFFDGGKFRDTSFLGTVGYAAPEQYGIAQSSPQSDVYALGVLLNVMLTGCHPADRLAKGRVGRIVLRSTLISPGKRYKSVRDFEKRL